MVLLNQTKNKMTKSSSQSYSAESIKVPVSLDQIKAHKELENIPLIKQSRLSVMPITKNEFQLILKLGKTKLRKWALKIAVRPY